MRRPVPHPRFVMFLTVFAVAVPVLAGPLTPAKAVVLGFDAAAAVFLLSTLPLWTETRADPNRARALRDDGGRAILLVVTAATLAVVTLALGQVIADAGDPTAVGVLVELGTMVLAWLFMNLVYAFHYAHLFYDRDGHAGTGGKPPDPPGDRGGLDFPGGELPVFSDFCYFSFVIGMTSQVADVAITGRHMRRTVLLHGLLSYVFNFGVIALTINMLASLF